MSARDEILKGIRAASPEKADLPDGFVSPEVDAVRLKVDKDESMPESSSSRQPLERLIAEWSEQARTAGSVVHHAPNLSRVRDWVDTRTWKGPLVTSLTGLESSSLSRTLPDTKTGMAAVDLLLVESPLGVAENGAVWISDESGVPRALPFLCREMAIVLNRNQIVPTMHEAYRELGVSPIHWGLFVGGPSKTADIEQSLVVGAHGPEALTLFLLES